MSKGWLSMLDASLKSKVRAAGLYLVSRISYNVGPVVAIVMSAFAPNASWLIVLYLLVAATVMLKSIRTGSTEIQYADGLSQETTAHLTKYFHYYRYPAKSREWSGNACCVYSVAILVGCISAWNFGWVYLLPVLPAYCWAVHLSHQFNPKLRGLILGSSAEKTHDSHYLAA